jgi:biopolymer transport protein ExbB
MSTMAAPLNGTLKATQSSVTMFEESYRSFHRGGLASEKMDRLTADFVPGASLVDSARPYSSLLRRSGLTRTGKMRARLRHFIIAAALVVATAPTHSAFAQTETRPSPSTPSSAPVAAPAAQQPTPANAATENVPAPPRSGEATVAVGELPQDLSPWGMFLHADIVVKAVMIGLAFASLVTWTVWLAKGVELLGARARVRRGLRVLAGSATLAQAHEQLRDSAGPVAQLMQATASEIRFSANLRAEGLKERIAWQLERIEMAAGRRISRGTGVLATIGSTAPFVGLFGTVWGIMDSFIGISKAHTTNLAVVAPGIAEALLATALGLVAAIPAVMIYNVLARSTAHYRALIGDASAQVMKLVSRDLDRAKLPLSHAAE